MAVLVLVEHDAGQVKPAVRACVAAAAKMAAPVHLLVMGHGVDAVAAQAAAIEGVEKVRVVDAPPLAHVAAEAAAAIVAALADGFSHILAPASAWGKNILPRAAALLDIQPISEIMAVHGPKHFSRPVYAGNAIAEITTEQAKIIATIRTTAFDAVAASGGNASIEKIAVPALPNGAKFVRAELSKSERPELTSARVVVSGGRALGSAENFALIDQLADALGAAVGASRAAVDAGYAPNDYQVGQTGKVVAPELYVAVGISGAIQHLAGMKDSKVIVAINKDAEAPIFQIADYGLEGDLFKILPELVGALKR